MDHQLRPTPAPSEFAAGSDGILPPSSQHEIRVVGIDMVGNLYLYGPQPTDQRQTIPSLAGVILDVSVVRLGQRSARGERDYLSVLIQSPTPLIRYLLRLPAHRSQHHYRSLLGKLIAVASPPMSLDLSVTPLKIEPMRGRGSKGGDPANFILVSLDPEGINQVYADSIPPGEQALVDAVAQIRSLIRPSSRP